MSKEVIIYPEYLRRLANPRELPRRSDVEAVVSLLAERKTTVTPASRHRSSYTPRTGVYGLFRESRLIYVGKSVTVDVRIGDHMGRWDFSHSSYIPVYPADLELIERRIIRTAKPDINRRHKIRRKGWGLVLMDDLAEVLSVTPGFLFDTCDRHGIGPTGQHTYEMQDILEALGRERFFLKTAK